MRTYCVGNFPHNGLYLDKYLVLLTSTDILIKAILLYHKNKILSIQYANISGGGSSIVILFERIKFILNIKPQLFLLFKFLYTHCSKQILPYCNEHFFFCGFVKIFFYFKTVSIPAKFGGGF